MNLGAKRVGHGYCCGEFAVGHHSELISVCFRCGRFYDNKTWTVRGPLGDEPGTAPAERTYDKRYFHNE